VEGKALVDSILTTETKNYIKMIRNKLQYTESSDDFDFAISMIPCRIIIFFNRGSSHFDVGVIRELKEKCFISQRTFSKDVSEEKLVSMGKGYKVTINRDVPVFVNLTDSLLSGLIKERMNVCRPLDLLNVNSAFGMRRDPISLCRKFHDGIDFQCGYQWVYSMLPGIVREVHHRKKRYGNYVLLDYGTCNVCTDIFPI